MPPAALRSSSLCFGGLFVCFVVDIFCFLVGLFVGWFVCCYKTVTWKSLLRLPPWARSKTPGSISWAGHSGRVALPAVIPKVYHCPETLYGVPTEVNTLQVDGLARIPGWRTPCTSRILSHPIASRDPPRLITLSTNTQGTESCVSSINTQGRQGEKRGRGQPMNNLAIRNSGLPPT